MSRRVLGCAAAALLLIAAAGPAQAQPASDSSLGSAPRWTVAGGLLWTGGYGIGESSADLLQNLPGSPPPLTLFRAAATVTAAPGVEARLGFAITPRLVVEAGGAYARPSVRVDVTDDLEAAAVSFDGETIGQFTLDVSALYELPVGSPAARLRPYAVAGGGYLRQLHADRVLVETGQVYHAGAGARWFLRGAAGDGRPLGVRADVQAAWRHGGIELEGKTRTMPTVSVLLFWGF